MSDRPDDTDEPQGRPIEASLAQALAWGAPMWILDQDGPPPRVRRSRQTGARSALRAVREWVRMKCKGPTATSKYA